MPKRKNVIGEKYERLEIVSDAPDYISPTGTTNRQVIVKCDCGSKEFIVALCRIRGGNTKSCGCIRKEKFRELTTKYPYKIRGLNVRDTPEYVSWKNMKQRVNNPNNPNYKYYGGKGVKIQQTWGDFTEFYTDMGERPHKTTLERIDTKGDYTKENCIWATRVVQARNRTNQKLDVDKVEIVRAFFKYMPHIKNDKIAKVFNCGTSTIWNVRVGNTFKEVEPLSEKDFYIKYSEVISLLY